MTDSQIGYSDLSIWQTFSQKMNSESVTSKKTTDRIYDSDKIPAFKQKLEVLENVYQPHWAYLSPNMWRFFSEVHSDINKCDFMIL